MKASVRPKTSASLAMGGCMTALRMLVITETVERRLWALKEEVAKELRLMVDCASREVERHMRNILWGVRDLRHNEARVVWGRGEEDSCVDEECVLGRAIGKSRLGDGDVGGSNLPTVRNPEGPSGPGARNCCRAGHTRLLLRYSFDINESHGCLVRSWLYMRKLKRS